MDRATLITALMSCCFFALSTSTLGQDPLSAARRYVEAVNRGDVTAIVALFTDDATVAHGRICTPPCVGDLAAVRRQYEQDVASAIKLTIVDSQVSGNTVSIRIEL